MRLAAARWLNVRYRWHSSIPAQEHSLRQRIQQDLFSAIRSKDSFRANVLRQLQAEIIKAEKLPIPETNTALVLLNSARRWREAIAEYLKLATEIGGGERRTAIQQTIDKESQELAIIESYLPPPYTREELDVIIRAAVHDAELAHGKPKKLGLVMRDLLSRLDHARIPDKKALSEHVGAILATT